MISRARPRNIVVDFMFLTKENVDEVIKWCGGWKAGLIGIEFYSQLHDSYDKAFYGNYVIKESDNPRHFREYSPIEFEKHFEVIDNAST